jgi:Eco57I restriction-modification methylase/TaqI-like C-terminal specificity domain
MAIHPQFKCMSQKIHFPIAQSSLFGSCPVSEAINELASNSQAEERGAIFTKSAVVEFMLDLAGYDSTCPLHNRRLLEPSFGGGEFLLAAVRRLLQASKSSDQKPDLAHCIRAVELHKGTFEATKEKLSVLLAEHGMSLREQTRLISSWLISGDFLLQPIEGHFDFVVGNPPYVRQEMIRPALLAQYRKLYSTLYDRADLYVPFIERSLTLLSTQGQLAFICADRWTKNKYGGPLRAMVAKDFRLRAYVDMLDTTAFDSDVIAYPAITLIDRIRGGNTIVVKQQNIDETQLAQVAVALKSGQPCAKLGVTLVEDACLGSEPWVLGSQAKRKLLRRLEELFPTLEEAGCKVGIGVATGNDKVFIGTLDQLDVEPSRKIPIATTKDIASGVVRWTGLGVINPFEDDGRLVELSRYPRLRAHFERHREAIAERHVAQKNPANWYRTIDRITPSLATRPKLFIPDIKGSAHVVFDEGKLYPHHNLYFVVSEHWDLRALQAVLLSVVARQFVAAYSTTMRGGYLRFQAQYLRRIHLPAWRDVPLTMRERLIKAATIRDLVGCDEATCELYGLTQDEVILLARS